MTSPLYVGQWLFRAVTVAAPFLTELEIQLQAHDLDAYKLGAAAIASVLVGVAHVARASAPGAAIGPPTELVPPGPTIGGKP